MSSDDYRPPWLPVNPVPEPSETSDNAPASEPDTVESVESEPLSTPEPAVEREGAPEPSTPAPYGNLSSAAPDTPSEPFSPPAPEARPSPSPSAAAAFFGVQREHAAAQREPDPVEPRPAEAEHAASAFEQSPQEPPAEREAPRSPTMSPYLSGTRPQTDHRTYEPPGHASAQDAWAPRTPPVPPVTGAVPTVRPDDLTPTKPQMPHSAHTPTPSFTPEPEPEPEAIPTPIEAEEPEIIAPILPPPPSEIMPRSDEEGQDSPGAPGSDPAQWSPPPTSEAPDATRFAPAPPDSVRQLGASAVSNASLQAAGAPTPTGGIPHVDGQDDSFPSFGDEEPFVPRFEPPLREAPPQPPSVSFAPPTARPVSPLSDVDVPETDEPAYAPRVELSSSPPPPGESRKPSRPWASVRDDDVEFAAPSILPGVGLEAAMLTDARADMSSAPDEDPTRNWAPPAATQAPIVSRRAVGDPPSGDVPRADLSPSGITSDRAAGIGAKGEAFPADATADGHDVTEVAPRRGKRWIWWLLLGLVVAAGAGILIYRTFLLPEPLTLPVPTITANPSAPSIEPISIEEPTDFVAALPDTVKTNVLVDYESIDPVTEPTLPARVAEHYTLSYDTGAGRADYVVEAYQHYNEDDAQVAYEYYAEGATDVEPVLVDGEQVGERALRTETSTGTVVWRNVTAVFVLTGPADSVLDFYEHYGV